MAFMRPFTSYMSAYEVDTDCGYYTVPADVLSASDFGSNGRPLKTAILKYTEGSKVRSIKKIKGWFARLSAPGYMDATDWQGPYKTEKAALDAVKDLYEVDDYGDDLDE